jgi:electron transfer flavoprotein alpha/beta subunit
MNEAELQARIESLQQTNVLLAEYLKVERATWRAKVAELEARIAELERELDSYRGVQDAG